MSPSRGAMVSVSAQTPLSAVLDDARTALARRVSYLCFPGLSRGADANGSANRRALCHDLDLPIRTDADAILGRAVDDYFETRFAEDAAAYCDRLRARLEGPAS